MNSGIPEATPSAYKADKSIQGSDKTREQLVLTPLLSRSAIKGLST